MSKKVKVAGHKSRTRERVSAPAAASSRSERRKLARRNAAIARKESIAQRMQQNPRLVKFTF